METPTTRSALGRWILRRSEKRKQICICYVEANVDREEPGSDVDHETLDAFTMAESKITSAENNAIFEADTIDDIEDPASAYRLGTARVCVTALNREWPENTVFDKVRQRPILPHHVENLVADFERRGVNRISEVRKAKQIHI